jgi:hypothetical protein
MPDVAPISLFSQLAALAYALTGMAALIAVARARKRLAMANWVAVAAIFAALVLWRLTNGEALWQDRIRTWARANGSYDDRQAWQVPLTLLAVMVIVAIAGWMFRSGRARHSGRALALALIMVIFTAVRAASLHAVDALLYASAGPIHVNYVIDMGLTALVALLAVIDWRVIGQPAEPRHRRRSSRHRHTRRD